MIYKILFSFLCSVIFLKDIHAQQPLKEAKRHFALNSYIDYINFSSNDLLSICYNVQSVYREIKEQYNGLIQLLKYEEQTLSLPLTWGTTGNNFLKNNYEKDILDYDTWNNITVRIFDSITFSFNKFLKKEEQQIIYPQLQKLHTIYLSIHQQYKKLDYYLDNRKKMYLDQKLSEHIFYDSINTYNCLDSIASYFIRFKLTKDDLEKAISSFQEKNIPSEWKQNGFYTIAQASKPLINSIQAFCNKIYSGDTVGLQKNIEELNTLKIMLIATANPILDTMFTFNKRAGNDPIFRFNRYIELVDKFVTTAKQLQNLKDDYYSMYGKNNIIGFYNREVIWPAFQFARAFNEFIDLANGKKRLDEALCCYSDNPRLNKTICILPNITFVPNRFDTDLLLKKNIVQLDSSKLSKDSIAQLISTSAFTHLVLLLDVSSSMKAPQRLDIIKNALQFIITYLRTEDRISIILFSGGAKTVIENISGMEKSTLMKALEQMQSKGSTNANAGIDMAYTIAKKYFIYNGNNRVIIGTDGDFSLTNQSKDEVKAAATQGISLSCLLVGNDANSSVIKFLEEVTDKGNGHFYKADSMNVKDILLKEITAIKTK